MFWHNNTVNFEILNEFYLMFKFRRIYLILTIVLFVIELLIALFVRDKIIRPYIGDLLVVMLLYCFVRGFFNVKVLPTLLGVLLFSFVVESLQYFKLLRLMNLEHSKTAKILLGSTFEWADLIIYTAGLILVFLVEKLIAKKIN